MAGSRHIRAAWIVGGSVFTIATLGFGTLQAVAGLAHEDRIIRTVVDQPIREIEIVASGWVTVIGGDAGPIRIRERVSDGLQHPDRSRRVDGDRLVLRGTCGGFPETFCADDFVVRAPRTVRVIIRSEGATVSRVRGGVEVSSDGDNVYVRRSAGPMRLWSHGGNIETTALAASRVASSSDGGNTTLSFAVSPQHVDANSSGGNVVLELPRRSVAYRVNTSTSGGSTDTQIRTDPTSTRLLHADSDGGNVTIRYSGQPDTG